MTEPRPKMDQPPAVAGGDTAVRSGRVPDRVVRGADTPPLSVSTEYLLRQLAWLQERDVDVLRFVYDWECAKRDQLIDLFFPSLSVANRRLTRLTRAHFLERIWARRPAGEPNHRQQACYVLGPASLPFLRAGDLAATRTGNRERSVQLMMVPHALETVEFLVTLRRAARAAGHRIIDEECQGPRRLRRDLIRLRGSDRRSHAEIVPDAYLVYERAEDRVLGFFLELDRGRERGDPFVFKANGYKAWFAHPASWRHLVQGPREQQGRFVGRFPAVLVVTTTERRMVHLVDDVVAAGTGPISWYFTNQVRIRETPGGILGPIWRRAPAGDFSLLDLV